MVIFRLIHGFTCAGIFSKAVGISKQQVNDVPSSICCNDHLIPQCTKMGVMCMDGYVGVLTSTRLCYGGGRGEGLATLC